MAEKQKNTKEYLDNLRHSAAHLLAASVLELYPNTKHTIGPSIENGFYFDFDFGDKKISDEDLAKIEEKMHEIVKGWSEFERIELDKKEALEKYSDNEYKKELINEFASEDKQLTLYKSGEYFDLCRGGHVENPNKELKHFKLLSIAGAYWRGDEKNKMLTRIYGTAFETKEELESHLNQLDEAKKRDHKKLGKELDLFVFSELVGSGLPLWTPKGTAIREELNDFVWSLRKKKGYQKVAIPHITKKDLYEKSGHWTKFSDELFKIDTREGHEFAMKPMNCPHHSQIFASKMRSYKEMPERYCETTMVYRDEQSGELSGLSRVRSITQDDAHVFCTNEQIEEEVLSVWEIVSEFYKAFDFKLQIRFSRHDPSKMEKYLGTPEIWKKSEEKLLALIEKRDVEYIDGLGEAAMYGPKIDFLTKDSLGRQWQVATIQLDFNQPEGLDLKFINEKGQEERPVMIHCAIMGSIERFTSILIEHFAGSFPTWLSPVQVKVLSLTERNISYSQKIADELKNNNIRVENDTRNETLGSKIRDGQKEKVPYMIIVGDKEESQNTISIRDRSGKTLEITKLEEFKKYIKEQIDEKRV